MFFSRNIFPSIITVRSFQIFLENSSELFASQVAQLVSTTPVANFLRVFLTLAVTSLRRFVLTTGSNDTSGKFDQFVTNVKETLFITNLTEQTGKCSSWKDLPPVSMTPAVNLPPVANYGNNIKLLHLKANMMKNVSICEPLLQ
jgi:hypothetical protein